MHSISDHKRPQAKLECGCSSQSQSADVQPMVTSKLVRVSGAETETDPKLQAGPQFRIKVRSWPSGMRVTN